MNRYPGIGNRPVQSIVVEDSTRRKWVNNVIGGVDMVNYSKFDRDHVYVSNFAVQMYKFMTEFALRILNIIFRCNSCVSVLTKVHTFHTLQMNPCILKILRNTAFESEHQNC